MWTLLIFIVFTPKPSSRPKQVWVTRKGNNSFPVVASAAELCWGNRARKVGKKQKKIQKKKWRLTLINWSDGKFSAATAGDKCQIERVSKVRCSSFTQLHAVRPRTSEEIEREKWKFQVQNCDVEEKKLIAKLFIVEPISFIPHPRTFTKAFEIDFVAHPAPSSSSSSSTAVAGYDGKKREIFYVKWNFHVISWKLLSLKPTQKKLFHSRHRFKVFSQVCNSLSLKNVSFFLSADFSRVFQ